MFPVFPSSITDGYLFFEYLIAWGGTTCFAVISTLAGFWKSFDLPNINGAFPRSKAGERSTSLGMMPRFNKLNMPSEMSSSVIGGGSANGSSRKCFGNILLGCATFFPLMFPIPNLSNSLLLMAPCARPYLILLGLGKWYLNLRRSWPTRLSGSPIIALYLCSCKIFLIGLPAPLLCWLWIWL